MTLMPSARYELLLRRHHACLVMLSESGSRKKLISGMPTAADSKGRSIYYTCCSVRSPEAAIVHLRSLTITVYPLSSSVDFSMSR